MKLSTFARLASVYYASGKSIYLRSRPGRGKTSVILDAVPRIAAELGKNLGVSIISGPNLTPGDTIGFGVPKHSTDASGRPVSEMVFTLPFFWRTEEGKLLEEYDGGVIFVDEADKMDVDIKKVMGEMALSGRAGSHKLPPGWVVWMAGNRQGDRSGSTKELDHLINRRGEIDIEDDLEGWEQWATKAGLNPVGIAFAVNNPQIVFSDTPEKQGPWCTPRSLVAAVEVLQTMAGPGAKLPTDTEAVETAAAFIGEAAAGQLFAMARLEAELPDMATIIAAPSTAKLPSKPDAQMLVSYKLAHMANAQNIGPIVQYMQRIPEDFGATFAKAAVNRQPMLVATPAMLAWAKSNASLMAMLGALK